MATGNVSRTPTLDEPSEAEVHQLQTLIRRCKDALSAASVACAHTGGSGQKAMCFVHTLLTDATRKIDLAELELIASSRDRRRRCACAAGRCNDQQRA